MRETRKGVLHDDDPHFSELFEALKNATAWRKDFFDTLKPPEALPPGLANFLTADFSPDDSRVFTWRGCLVAVIGQENETERRILHDF